MEEYGMREENMNEELLYYLRDDITSLKITNELLRRKNRLQFHVALGIWCITGLLGALFVWIK